MRLSKNILIFALFMAVMLLVPASGLGGQDSVGLFNSFSERDSSNIIITTDEGTLTPRRLAVAELNAQALSPGILAGGNVINIGLFDDLVLKVRITDVSDEGKNIVMRGIVEDTFYGYMVMTARDNQAFATIELPEMNRHYQLFYDSRLRTHVIKEYDLRQWQGQIVRSSPENAEEHIFEVNPVNSDFRGSASENVSLDAFAVIQATSIATIDVMVIYTPAAASWARSDSAVRDIDDVIDRAMAIANQTLENSKTFTVLNIVHRAQINYSETGDMGNDLDNLIDRIPNLRNQYGADIVIFFAYDNRYTYGLGGMAYTLYNPGGNPNTAFNINHPQWSYAHSTVIHELGHNIGAGHHKQQTVDPGPQLFDYSAGWHWIGTDNRRYCSVMTYDDGEGYGGGLRHTNVAHFSDPAIIHTGRATGHPQHANNAETIRRMRHIIAAYRSSGAPPTTPLTAPVLLSPNDNAVIAGTVIDFAWNAVADAAGYRIQVDTSGSFTSTVIDDFINTTAGTWSTAPNDGSTFYWRVRAENASSEGPWSTPRRFINGSVAPIPAAPTLLSPGNNANAAGTAVHFSWNAVSGATRYWLRVTRVSDNQRIVDQNVGNVTLFNQTGGFLNDGAVYNWQVWAGTSAGWSANSSATWTFTNGTATTTPTRDYLAGSFASGTYRYNSGPNRWDWTISSSPARALTYTDMTGSGTLNLVASWDGWGTGYYEGGRWVRLTTSVAGAMVSNGIQLAVSVPSGTYIYDPPHQRWILRSTTPANAVASIKMAEDGYSSHLVASFPGSGVFYWSNGQWIRFAQNSAVTMGGSGQWLYISFPSGTFMYNHLENPNQWTRITTSVATAIGVAGMVDDGYFNAVCSFPSGTYYREWTGTGQRWHYLASPALALAGREALNVQSSLRLGRQGLIDIE